MTEYPQFCALARAAELIGERWSLLVLRELMLGPRRFTDLRDRLRPITPSVLSQRLKQLSAAGLVERVQVREPIPGQLFALTPAGQAFRPAMLELIRWGARFLFPQREGEAFETEWLRLVFEAYARPGASPRVTVAFRVEGYEMSGAVQVRGGPGGTSVAAGEEGASATITASPAALLGIMSGRLPLAEAVRQGAAAIEGDAEAAKLAPALFEAAGSGS